MDDTTNEHYSMFFVDEDGTASSFQGFGKDSSTGFIQFSVHGQGKPLLVHAQGGRRG